MASQVAACASLQAEGVDVAVHRAPAEGSVYPGELGGSCVGLSIISSKEYKGRDTNHVNARFPSGPHVAA